MSFYNYSGNGCPTPGPIENSPEGLCERACVQVRRVYDSCMQQAEIENVSLDLTDIRPRDQSFTAPLTFISCRGVPNKTVISDLSVDPISGSDNLARVRCTVHVPIEVLFRDANGREGAGRSVIRVVKDVILYVPSDSIIPYYIEAASAAVCATGAYSGGFRFCLTVCVTVILKVLAEVDILIPTYGYCQIPPCQEFSSGVCDDFFALPIYPPSDGCECPKPIGTTL